jgi:hypothetical protein
MLANIYIVVTTILFSINLLSNIIILATTNKEKFPVAAVFATVLSVIFVIWGIVILVV